MTRSCGADMQIDLKHILQALAALREAEHALMYGSDADRGIAAAHCVSAWISIEVRLGCASVDVLPAPEMTQ